MSTTRNHAIDIEECLSSIFWHGLYIKSAHALLLVSLRNPPHAFKLGRWCAFHHRNTSLGLLCATSGRIKRWSQPVWSKIWLEWRAVTKMAYNPPIICELTVPASRGRSHPPGHWASVGPFIARPMHHALIRFSGRSANNPSNCPWYGSSWW